MRRNILHILKKLRLALAVLVIATVYVGFRAATPRPMNVLLITLDTTRADRIGCYGYSTGSTPNIDRVARQGVLFQRAFATVPLTLPSHASILTGLYPPEHGLRVNGRDSLPAEPETLAALLREKNYSTAAFVSSFVLDKKFGLNRGFQRYDDSIRQSSGDFVNSVPRDAADVTTTALGWLEEHSQSPFLCWVHYIDPHFEYNSHPESFGERFRSSPYDGEVAFMDLHLGRLLKFLDQRQLEENTLVVIVADHGEAFGEHGERNHGTLVYNTTMHVPFIMRPPNLKNPGKHVGSLVSQVDVLPTILDYLNINSQQPLSGRSLKALIAGGDEPDRSIYMESLAMTPRGWAPQHVVARGAWKFVRSPIAELFDLKSDPGELKNLVSTAPEITTEMHELLVHMESKFQRRDGKDAGLTPGEMAQITAGGYAAGPQQIQNDAGPRGTPDVKTMLPYYYQVLDALELVGQDAPKAEALARKVIADHPEYEAGWAALGTALNQQKRIAEAVPALLRALTIDRTSRHAHKTLGDIRHAQKNLPEAEEHYQEVLRQRPDDVELRLKLAAVLLESGKPEPTLRLLESAIEIESSNSLARIALAETLLKLGKLEPARNHAEISVTLEPNNAAARLQYGSILSAMGETQAAVVQYRKAALLAPTDSRTHLGLAEVLFKLGDKQEARLQLQQVLNRTPSDPKARELLDQWDGPNAPPTSKAQPVGNVDRKS